MNSLSKVFVGKIAATVICWCVPMILFPATLLEAIGLPQQSSYLFVRLLGWAYLALCVGYGFGLQASLRGTRAMGPIWVGIISNGGAFAILLYHGFFGEWQGWGVALQLLLWASALVTAAITAGLYFFGVKGVAPQAA